MLIEDILTMPEFIPVLGVIVTLGLMCYGLLKRAVLYQLIAFIVLFFVLTYMVPLHMNMYPFWGSNSLLNLATLFLSIGFVCTLFTFFMPYKIRLTSYINTIALFALLISLNLYLKLANKEMDLREANGRSSRTLVVNSH